MAGKAYARTASYDAAIANWFAFSPTASDEPTLFPATLPLAFKRADTLRYGENPHQSAAIYVPQMVGARGVPQAAQLQGKELSYNNLNDADAALELAAEFAGGAPAVVIVKHANPCGKAARCWRLGRLRSLAIAFRHLAGLSRSIPSSTARPPKRLRGSSLKW